MELIKLINSINKEGSLNIATTNLELFSDTSSHNIEKIEDNLDTKRFFHFIVIDKEIDNKKLFRALRNGGYLISLIELDDNELNDIGFSAISRFEGFLIAKKVHSWNDW